MKYLLSKKADVNIREHQDKTALHRAVELNEGKSHLEVIKLLLKNKADLNGLDTNGWTPIHYLGKKDDIEVFDLVLKHRDRIYTKFRFDEVILDDYRVIRNDGDPINDKNWKIDRLMYFKKIKTDDLAYKYKFEKKSLSIFK